jgi:hypothetical protein
MVAAARHFGFEKEWSDYVDSNPGETIQELFYMLILFKAKFANSGKGLFALHWSPEEGMHRMVAALIMTTLSTVNLQDGSLNGPMTLQYDNLV